MVNCAGISLFFLVLQAVVVGAPPAEPPFERQLWREKQCFAHEVPEWRHLVLRQLSGTIFAFDMVHTDPLPDARVFIRTWPNGRQFETRTDSKGRFSLPKIGEGTYEVAVCQNGFNPWRGTVRVSKGATKNTGEFPVTFGQ